MEQNISNYQKQEIWMDMLGNGQVYFTFSLIVKPSYHCFKTRLDTETFQVELTQGLIQNSLITQGTKLNIIQQYT